MLYEVTGEEGSCQDLRDVIHAHREYIQATTKGPLFLHTQERRRGKLIGEDKQKAPDLVQNPVDRRVHFIVISSLLSDEGVERCVPPAMDLSSIVCV